MNIVIFNWRDWTHPWAGGAELQVQYQCREFSNAGHHVTLITSRPKGTAKEECVEGATIFRGGGKLGVYFCAPWIYWTQCRKKTDVIIDTHNGIPFFTPFFSKKSILLLIHHISPRLQFEMEFRSRLAARFGLWLQNWLMPRVYRSKSVMTVSESTRKEVLARGFSADKIHVIYNGLDHTIYQPKLPKTAFPSIVYVGRLKAYKRLPILISAFAKVIKKIPEARLVIAGSGDHEEEIRKEIQRHQLDRVVSMEGFVSEERKVELLQSAWWYATPTSVEGWGLGVLEAAACGTPAIGFNVPGISESVRPGETGLLVPEGGDFAATLIRGLIEPAIREKLSRGAINHARQFHWTTIMQQELDLLKSLL